MQRPLRFCVFDGDATEGRTVWASSEEMAARLYVSRHVAVNDQRERIILKVLSSFEPVRLTRFRVNLYPPMS